MGSKASRAEAHGAAASPRHSSGGCVAEMTITPRPTAQLLTCRWWPSPTHCQQVPCWEPLPPRAELCSSLHPSMTQQKPLQSRTDLLCLYTRKAEAARHRSQMQGCWYCNTAVCGLLIKEPCPHCTGLLPGSFLPLQRPMPCSTSPKTALSPFSLLTQLRAVAPAAVPTTATAQLTAHHSGALLLAHVRSSAAAQRCGDFSRAAGLALGMRQRTPSTRCSHAGGAAQPLRTLQAFHSFLAFLSPLPLSPSSLRADTG